MIYIVSPGGTLEKGGMGRIVDNFTADLRENRPDVKFEVIDSYGPDAKFHLMPFYFAAAMLRLFGCFVTGKAQLVHIHMAEYGSVLRKGLIVAMASLFRVPVVLHLHGGRFPKHYEDAKPLSRWAIRHMMEMTSEVVVLGEYWRNWVVTTFPAVRRTTLLHNAVPGPETIPERAEDGPVRLLFLGRLIKLKGIDVLLDALASEACRSRSWQLTIAGDGDLETYRAQAKALGLEDRVRFTGWLDQTGCRKELVQAHVLVQPSMFEGLPMSVLEAMANGLTIVATPVGSVGDAIADEETGLLVPPGDRAALAEALARVIDDAELRRRLGQGARRRFERQFDIAVYRERIVEIYRRNARGWMSEPAPTASIGPRRARSG
ncbi:glycosyl transferase family 1 (plasmid) [Azospirillum sp. TSH58]|uniref:glycosyltransferase family 4 protein n=1 Tax=Azospirillum sp. TSH58 TaxID=664962 RepID=UPI000D602D83|nr:glycosyltransferase family 4 protein [Azospirillum sp. TSH58]AWJ86703.1 glycosyl transferase family 1 [Azospirillum sp. TSH58]PWC67191.1 glycosyl transferase family 1 [Azospirillum sp. TSH58]